MGNRMYEGGHDEAVLHRRNICPDADSGVVKSGIGIIISVRPEREYGQPCFMPADGKGKPGCFKPSDFVTIWRDGSSMAECRGRAFAPRRNQRAINERT